MDFSTIAYAKLNLKFDRDVFIEEYDRCILPLGEQTMNTRTGILKTYDINKRWGMVPEEEYLTVNYLEQEGGIDTAIKVDNGRPQWTMFQLMSLDTSNIDDPLLKKWGDFGGAGLRNETLDEKYRFHLKKGFEDLEIVKWIYQNLPFKKINFIHCVSLEANSFASIHRDSKAFRSNELSSGINRVFKSGYIVVNINISSGGVPLYWALDGKDLYDSYKSDDDVYITNDYFYHGVPICSSRRRQIRITGVPDDRFFDLIDRDTLIDLGSEYNFIPDIQEVDKL